MKITRVPNNNMVSQYMHVRENTAANKKSQSSDKVELTNDSQSFSVAFKAAKEAASASEKQRATRAEQIKKQLQENAYSVSGYEIAKKILGE